jgi:hypothetical protein
LQGFVGDFLPSFEALLTLHANNGDICKFLARLGVARRNGAPYSPNTFSKALSRTRSARQQNEAAPMNVAGRSGHLRIVDPSGGERQTTAVDGRSRQPAAPTNGVRQNTTGDGSSRPLAASAGIEGPIAAGGPPYGSAEWPSAGSRRPTRALPDRRSAAVDGRARSTWPGKTPRSPPQREGE